MILLLLAALGLAAPEMIPLEDTALKGRTAPPIEAQLDDGAPFSLDDQRGKVVVLSFWASWCGPCRLELPALSALAAQRPGVAVYAVNVDRERNDARGFLRKVRFELPIVWDNQAMAMGGYGILSMPTMVVLDTNGTVVWTKVGFSREKGLTELEAELDRLGAK